MIRGANASGAGQARQDVVAVVNGGSCHLPAGATVEDVLSTLSSARAGVAVAVNGEVVPRALWARTTIAAGDHVEVLTAAQGG
ncbi:MAG: sulfur carrier protein ThiS [Acidimicrobiales bacterium]